MRIAAAALAAVVAGSALAAPCDRLEFAEMDAMDRGVLLALRCQYTRDMLQAGAIGNSYGLAVADRCAGESTRMDRILARKYSLSAKGDALIVAINDMCARAKRPP